MYIITYSVDYYILYYELYRSYTSIHTEICFVEYQLLLSDLSFTTIIICMYIIATIYYYYNYRS